MKNLRFGWFIPVAGGYMRAILFVVALIAFTVLAGLTERNVARIHAGPVSNTASARNIVDPVAPVRMQSALAAYPDRGLLFTYDRARRTVRSGASTWHPVRISEVHALRAIAEGGMTIEAPDGRTIRLRYERHIEHPDGNWTWIGRAQGGAPGTETVLTFGEKAVFGLIRQDKVDLKLTTEAGSAWLVETDTSKLDRNRLAASGDDFLLQADMPHSVAAAALKPVRKDAVKVPIEQVAGVSAAQSPAWSATTVDIAVGYTDGFATRLGGASQALTRLNHMVDLANQAYLDSDVDAQIRIVRTLQVAYPDATSNYSALVALTGVQCTTQTNGTHYLPDRRLSCTPVAQPAALEPLTSARDTYGADLVVLVRKFEDPENGSCGLAWLLGGGQTQIDAGSAAFGMAVVSDSSGSMFPDNNNTCREDALAHELGHNMGQQHDVVTASGTDDSDGNNNLLDPEEYGRHPYSFGYSTDGTANDFYTIMSVRRPGQTGYRIFSNPRIALCGGAVCGTVDQADNARSLGETMPVVAGFRATEAVFWDVTGDFWAFDSIRRLANAGVTGGCAVDPPLYCPASVVTRDQMAVFLLRGMHGSAYEPPAITNSSFADVPSGFWAISWIEQLALEGITSGCATNPLRYCPSAAVSRDQMAVFLLRAKHGANYAPPPATGEFTDVPASYWAAAWIEQLAAEGITGGCSTTPKQYCPTATVTRDQMAVFLVRTFNL